MRQGLGDMTSRRTILTAILLVATSMVAWAVVASREPDAPSDNSASDAVSEIVDARRASYASDSAEDADGPVSVLLIGLDARAGSDVAHCDVIQLFEIDPTAETIRITAVPRGTYSPLPPGGDYVPGDFYVSNACGIGGVAYGIAQIEKILGRRADHLAVVGFSEAVGAFRLFGLPTTETLQWLRVRQPYAVGEPQRAHNHSTFLRQALINYAPVASRLLATPVGPVLYNLVRTDLSYAQTRAILDSLSEMNLAAHPERITLSMVPAYDIRDIPYDPASLETALDTPFNPTDGPSRDEAQRALADLLIANIGDPEFSERAFAQRLWMQVDDAQTRESAHFALLSSRVSLLADEAERQALIADYVIEMDALELPDWAERGRDLLAGA